MNLSELFQRLMDEDKWREQQAAKLGVPQNSSMRGPDGMLSQQWGIFTGDHLGGTFDQRAQSTLPGLFNRFDAADQKDAQADELMKSIENALGPKPSWFEERYQLYNMLNKFKTNSQNLYKKGGV